MPRNDVLRVETSQSVQQSLYTIDIGPLGCFGSFEPLSPSSVHRFGQNVRAYPIRGQPLNISQPSVWGIGLSPRNKEPVGQLQPRWFRPRPISSLQGLDEAHLFAPGRTANRAPKEDRRVTKTH